MRVKSESEVAQSCPTLSDPMAAAYQARPSMGFSRREYWSGVPSPSPIPALGTGNSAEKPFPLWTFHSGLRDREMHIRMALTVAGQRWKQNDSEEAWQDMKDLVGKEIRRGRITF